MTVRKNAKNVLRQLSIGALALLLAACSNQSNTASNAQLTAPAEPPLLDKIKTLEDNGTFPKLDRSADIKGPDANNNGVRDDIDAWIAALPITDKQKKAAIQKAQYFQKTLLLDLKDKSAMQASFDEMMASGNCLDNVFTPDYQEGFKLASKIEALTANTKNRADRYLQYSRAASGTSAMLPNGDTCK